MLPLATCGYWALEMWLETCKIWILKTQKGKKSKYLINSVYIINLEVLIYIMKWQLYINIELNKTLFKLILPAFTF